MPRLNRIPTPWEASTRFLRPLWLADLRILPPPTPLGYGVRLAVATAIAVINHFQPSAIGSLLLFVSIFHMTGAMER